jgi:hypothetical protein
MLGSKKYKKPQQSEQQKKKEIQKVDVLSLKEGYEKLQLQHKLANVKFEEDKRREKIFREKGMETAADELEYKEEDAEEFAKKYKEKIEDKQLKREQKYELAKSKNLGRSQKMIADIGNYANFISEKLEELIKKLDAKYNAKMERIRIKLVAFRAEFDEVVQQLKIAQKDKKQLEEIVAQLKLDLLDTEKRMEELKIANAKAITWLKQRHETEKKELNQEKQTLNQQKEVLKKDFKGVIAQQKSAFEIEKGAMKLQFEKEKANLVPKEEIKVKKVSKSKLLKQIDDRIKQVKNNIKILKENLSKNNNRIKEIEGMPKLRENFHKKELKGLYKSQKNMNKRIADYEKEITLLDSIIKLPGLEGKGCKPGYAINPKSRRCVGLKSKLGKKLLAQGLISNCNKQEILNTKTNKCIRRDSPEGKKILSQTGLENSQKLLDKYYSKQKNLLKQVENRVSEVESTLTQCQIKNRDLSKKVSNLEQKEYKIETEYNKKKKEISSQTQF